jgi:hypothetical protein
MAKISMEYPLPKEFAKVAYPDLTWTPEEEEAFNLIPALEWPRPSLLTRFNRAVNRITGYVLNCMDFYP